MNIFSAICESIRRAFGVDCAAKPPVSTNSQSSQPNEPISPIVITPAGNPIPPTPPAMAQPAPVVENKTETKPEITTEKAPKKPRAPKESKSPTPAKEPKPKAEKVAKKGK